MGGCLSFLLVQQNRLCQVPDSYIKERREYGPLAIVSAPPEGTNCSPVYRVANVSDDEHRRLCKEWYEGENILQRLEQVCSVWEKEQAIAYRVIEQVKTEKRKDIKGVEKSWQVAWLSDAQYITYGTFWEKSIAFGRGLKELGLTAGARIGMYEDTRWEWLVSVIGMWTQEMVTVTVYANLGEAALLHALKEAECSAIVCNGKKIKTLYQLLKKANMTKPKVICLDEMVADLDAEDMTLLSWSDVVEKGMCSSATYSIRKDPESTSLIMYTSGTTFDPKGVIHTFGSLNAGFSALSDRLQEATGKKVDGETYLAFLPLAHILEFIAELVMLIRGTRLCYGSPRTLSDVSAYPRGDISEYKPMLFIGVPRIFETIRKAVESKLPPPGSIKRRIFDAAYAARLQAIKNGKDTPFLNKKVFAAARATLGGNMRAILSGGAPLGNKTQEFMNVVFGVPMVQGYGLTETCCNGTVQRNGELYPAAGQLLKGVEAMLRDTEEYKHTDKPYPRGELLLRTPALFKGYLKQEKLTREAFLPDGNWFLTGDVAEFDNDNCLHIIGRVKALAKNVLGEYIALEALEAMYGQHLLACPNGVCVLVRPDRSYICALVLTDETRAMSFAAEKKIAGVWPDILDDPFFCKNAVEGLVAVAKEEGRQPMEFVRNVRLLNDEWTAENGILTASMKICRNVINEHYATVIDQLFTDE